MNKGGKTLNDIREVVKRNQQIANVIYETKTQREAEAVYNVVETNFKDADDQTKMAAMEILSKGLDNIDENYSKTKQDAMKEWGEAIGVDQYLNYKGQGTAINYKEGEGGQWETERVSANEGWYREYYARNGHAPSKRDRFDIAHKALMDEMDHAMDTMPDAAEDIKAEKERIEGLRQRVETLENMGDTISNMDKSDLQARALLSQEAYEQSLYTCHEGIRKRTGQSKGQCVGCHSCLLQNGGHHGTELWRIGRETGSRY